MAITGYREEKAWKGCMNRKTTLDITIILSGITGMVLSYAYLEDPMERQVSLIVLGTVSFFSFCWQWQTGTGQNIYRITDRDTVGYPNSSFLVKRTI